MSGSLADRTGLSPDFIEGVASTVISSTGSISAVEYFETAIANYRNTSAGYTALATTEEAAIGMGTIDTSMMAIGEAGLIAGKYINVIIYLEEGMIIGEGVALAGVSLATLGPIGLIIAGAVAVDYLG